VCVIGTGAGGAAALARLAEQGIDAVAVEAGPHTTAAEFTQRELEMLPLLYQEAALRATADKAIGIMQGRGVGGSTLHNTGLVYPTPAGILDRWRREHAFPWDDASWQGYVDEVLRTLRATPIPPEQINPNNDALRRGCEALGWRYRVPLHNREECCGCGYCMLGCAYNRKLGASLTWLPRAVTAGARILADAPVTRIEGRAGMRRVVWRWCTRRWCSSPRGRWTPPRCCCAAASATRGWDADSGCTRRRWSRAFSPSR
jgi:choline dehydrogenase-like flavoprotein